MEPTPPAATGGARGFAAGVRDPGPGASAFGPGPAAAPLLLTLLALALGALAGSRWAAPGGPRRAPGGKPAEGAPAAGERQRRLRLLSDVGDRVGESLAARVAEEVAGGGGRGREGREGGEGGQVRVHQVPWAELALPAGVDDATRSAVEAVYIGTLMAARRRARAGPRRAAAPEGAASRADGGGPAGAAEAEAECRSVASVGGSGSVEEIRPGGGGRRGAPTDPTLELSGLLTKALEEFPRTAQHMDSEVQLKALDTMVKLHGALLNQRGVQLQQAQLEMQFHKLRAVNEQNDVLRESNGLAARAEARAEATGAEESAARARTEKEKRAARFRAHCADDLWVGVLVMLAVMAASLRGQLTSHMVFSACRNRYVGALSLFSPTLYVEFALCCAGSLTRLVGSYAVLFLFVAQVLQRNVLRRYQSAPLAVLLLVLGGGCGIFGQNAIDSMGGNGSLWFYLWVTFCAAHAGLVVFAEPLLDALSGPVDLASKAAHRPSAGQLALRAALGVALPAAIGWVPCQTQFLHVLAPPRP